MRGEAVVALVFGALAAGIRPMAEILPATWTAEHIVVPDGPHEGDKWNPAITPQLIEPLNLLSPSHPCNIVAFRKSGQIGYTTILQGWMGFLIDVAPSKSMLVQPTIIAAQDFNREKFAPLIAQSKTLKAKVRSQISRSSEGSTALVKRFPGGSIRITGANSSADLRSKTLRNIACDEIDEYPDDLEGQGDPMGMIAARQIAFTATGDWKRFLGSTPTIKGISRIDDAFMAGDQRYWQCPCPHCGGFQKLEFFPDSEGKGGLRFNAAYPFEAYYACRAQGCVIEHWQKKDMVSAGRWVAEAPGAGRYPSFHLDALCSLLTTWDEIAKTWVEADGHPLKLKTFYNLWLGLPYEEKGDAPEWKRLYDRREAYRHGTLPPGALVITAAADVQQNGIYYEVVAWGAGLTSWTIDAGYLTGETADFGSPVWEDLTRVETRAYLDIHGNRRRIRRFAIDAGYNTAQVYKWARANRERRCAVKGVPGPNVTAIASAAEKDITRKGRKDRHGAKLWLVGTYTLKSTLYAYLDRKGPESGAAEYEAGYCHFGQDLDEAYFKQLTAEYRKEVTRPDGRTRLEWHAKGDNHYHDCRIYNLAMACHPDDRLHLYTADRWLRLRAELEKPSDRAPDLVQIMTALPVAATPAPTEAPRPAIAAKPRRLA